MADVLLRRTKACRLVPELSLDSFEEVPDFLEDRALLTLTPCCSLPSLFGACHEEPHSPGKGGYGQYPRTRWWWGGALAECPGVTATKLHRGTTLFLAGRLVRMVDPLCRAELSAAAAGDHGSDAARLVDHLGAAGPTTTEDLKVELGLTSSALRRLRRRLERVGAILPRHLRLDTPGGGHRHTSQLSRWDQAVPGAEPVRGVGEALADLIAAAVDAGSWRQRRTCAASSRGASGRTSSTGPWPTAASSASKPPGWPPLPSLAPDRRRPVSGRRRVRHLSLSTRCCPHSTSLPGARCRRGEAVGRSHERSQPPRGRSARTTDDRPRCHDPQRHAMDEGALVSGADATARRGWNNTRAVSVDQPDRPRVA